MVQRAAKTVALMLVERKWTLPSAISTLAPPGWKLYTSQSLLQFMKNDAVHGAVVDCLVMAPAALVPLMLKG